jgi:hypothetical protein
MRSLLVVVAVLALAALAWLLFFQGDGPSSDPSAARSAEEAAAETAEAAKARKRSQVVQPRAESVSEFLAEWPQIGQDREQDPKLGAITGRVLAAVDRPVREAVVESSQRGTATARVRTKSDGSFHLKNVPPGTGIALTARAEGYAPGGFDRLMLDAGETLDVGLVYLGGALDPTATNHVDVIVTKTGTSEPVAGALVTATSTLAGALVALGNWEKQPGGTVVRVTTDAAGKAVFDKLPPNFYDFLCEAEGLTFVARQRVIVQRDTRTKIDFDLGPALTIEGKVLDEAGKPIEGARVGAFRFANFTMHPAAATDQEGAFTIGGLASGGYMLFAVKEGHGEKNLQNVEAGKKGLEIVLPLGSAMAIRVVDAATSKPLTEFAVRPFRNQPFAYVYSPRVDVRAEDGVWRQTLDKGSWGVEVSAKGYAMKALSTVPLEAKEPVEVKLEGAGVVHGRVVGKDGGRPVIGARVFVKRGGMPPSPVKDQQSSTDKEGVFVLDNLSRVATKLTIVHVDHTEASFDAEPAPRGEGGALPPAVEFALSDGGRVIGHVYGPGRTPLGGQTVTLMKGFDFSAMRSTQTGEDGAYDLRNVPPDKYTLSLGGTAMGGGRGQRTEVDVTDGGTVTFDFGADAGGQRVRARLLRGEEPVSGLNVTLSGGDVSMRGASDAQGAVVFEGVKPGKYTLAPTFLASSAEAEVVVTAETPPAEVVMQLPVLGSIEIKVVDDATGKPLNGAWTNYELTADADGTPPSEVKGGPGGRPTADDGIAVFRNLEAGRYRIRVWRDPYGSEMLDDVALAAGETKAGIEIRLGDAGVISGKVLNSAGKPIDGAAVQIRDSAGRVVFLVSIMNTSADGTFTQAQVKPGSYDVAIEKDGYAPATRHVEVALGKDTKIDFTLLKGGWIDLTVRTADGAAVANANVTLFDSAGRRVEKGLTMSNILSSTQTKTDGNGQVTVPGIAPGSYVVKVRREDGTEAQKPVDVVEGASAALEIRYPAQ